MSKSEKQQSGGTDHRGMPPPAGEPFDGDVELDKRQMELLRAVETFDKDKFIRFGGSTTADINFEITKDGAFPFLIACAKGNLDFVNLMLCNPGLDINKTDKNGVNCYFMAAYHGHIPIMRRLMEKGIDMFRKNSNGSNVLHIAVKREQMDIIHELIRI